MEEIQKTEIHYVEKNSSIYPARLRELSGMPKQLYYIGRFPEDNKPTAAIVGARLCSAYGRIQAFRYGKFLSEHGVQVISGMAAGIDAEGHKGALEGGTPTFAVLGNGVDICYIGIQGTTISKYQSENLDIPRGVYVDAVEEDSPAMTAGVQNADIVHALNGKEISSMNRYSAILQSLVKGSRVKLEVYRKNPYGTYVNVELNVLIKEK